MIFMIAATLIVPAGDVISKFLTSFIGPMEITLYRYLFQALFLALAIAVFKGSFRFQRAHIGLLCLGGATSALTLIALIGAFKVMPVATAIAIFFVEPLILTLLSVFLLGEKVGWRRYAAIAVGMFGALVVIRPNWATFGWPAIFPLFAALAFAFNAIAIRKLSSHMSGLTIQFWFSAFAVGFLIVGLGGATALGFFTFEAGAMELPYLAIFPLQGILSAFTFYLFTEAFRRSEASVIAPFQYIEIIGATMMGYLAFGDFPDALTWVGTAIILMSGIYVFRRERQQHVAATVEAQRE